MTMRRLNPQPYSAYKPSGVEWLGDVPEHWEVRRLKTWLGTNELVLPEDTDPEYTFDYLDIGLVTKGRLVATPERLRFGNSPSRARRVVSLGDTLVSTVRTYLKAVWHAEHFRADLIASTGFAVLTPRRSTFPKFVSYFCQSDPFTNRVTAESVGIAYPAIAETRLGTFQVCVPPLAEQTAIVRFLDHADRRIRRYIRAKQKLIALLEEQKQATINQAVTGQIDVRTSQPYPAYKDSGVEWLGEVPRHWEATPLGRVLIQRKEKNDPIKTTDILSLSLKTGVIPYAEKEAGGNKAKEDLSAYMLAYPGDIVVNSMNVVVGSVGLSKYFGAVSPVYYMLRPRHQEDLVEYFERIFQNISFQRSLFGIGNGIMFIESKSSGKLNTIRLRIPMTKLKKVILPWPPAAEQADIVRHLDRVNANIASAIARAKREIDLLNEYRTRLIADVVTGKLDVREAAAELPEVDPLAEDDLDGIIHDKENSNLGELDAEKSAEEYTL